MFIFIYVMKWFLLKDWIRGPQNILQKLPLIDSIKFKRSAQAPHPGTPSQGNCAEKLVKARDTDGVVAGCLKLLGL